MRTYGLVCVAFGWLLGCNPQEASHGRTTDLPDAPNDTVEEVSCFDGLDNDNDGMIDCADPGCAAIAACVAAVPDGWAGHAMLYDGDPATPPPGCAGLWGNELVAGQTAPSGAPASCSACACAAPSGGSCSAVGGDATLTPVRSARIGIACTMPEAAPEPTTGCTAGVCAPTSAPGDVMGVCIYHNGDVACPAGPFGDRHVFYADTLDTRGCAACDCAAPSGGACAPSGGEATGGVEGALPTTFCCVSQP